MDYKEKYEQALARAKEKWAEYKRLDGDKSFVPKDIEFIFPELQSQDEKNIRYLIHVLCECGFRFNENGERDRAIEWLNKMLEPTDTGEISDGYHTFNELYDYRMLYNAAFFNLLPPKLVHKSKKHHDGKPCFEGGWFIVMANLPTGQISNHYELKYWDLFHISEVEIADEWDGHTPQEAADRLRKYLVNYPDLTYTEVPAGLDYAEMILEATVGKVSGFQSDDGVMEHKTAIEAIKSLKSRRFVVWDDEDDERLTDIIAKAKFGGTLNNDELKWLEYLRTR